MAKIKQRVVLASNNPGKIHELKTMLADFQIDLISQQELGVEEVAETGLSFIENALIKARHASRHTGLPALADDSGLAVLSLNGAPGIYSARYAGMNANAHDNMHKLLFELKDIPQDQRQASFHCVIAFLLHAEDPTPLICEGKWSGIILSETKGQAGFGYDPIFYIPSIQQSAAELSAQQKNKISHRGIAMQSLIQKLPEKLS